MELSDVAEMDRSAMLLAEPYDIIKLRLEETVNIARWSGDWKGVPRYLVERFDNVPLDYQQRFRGLFEGLSEFQAFDYQRHDAALAALMKNCMLTHNMGLGKTRISILAAEAIQKSTLVVALPRLVRVVWAAEFSKLGIEDWIVLERPKQSKMEFVVKRKGSPDKYRGLKGIGKLKAQSVVRDSRCTTDPGHPARYKIVSYNMLLPITKQYDYVICPECGHKHNQERCPNITFGEYTSKANRSLYANEKEWVDRKIAAHLAGKLTFKQLEREVSEKHPNLPLSVCRTPLKGANCPHCYNPIGNYRRSPVSGETLFQAGYFCSGRTIKGSRCNYSSRVWIPSLTRRLKNRVKVAILDESQAVKNWQSLRTKYALSLRIPYRYITSGTPATTDVASDLYYQLRWLFGDKVMFPFESRNDFVRVIDGQKDTMVRLYQILDPVQIRREADDYGVSIDVELPPVRERRFTIPMSPEETANYQVAENNIKEWYASVNGEATELDLFSKMWILRRAACTPWVDNAEITTSTKIEALKIEVENLLRQNRKILIGSEMLDMLNAIEEAIPGAVRIDGSVPIKTADTLIALFQETCPTCKMSLVEEFGEKVCPLCETKYETPMVMITSRSAVREGVTLNKASCVIATDPSWTYASIWQWWKRAHRVGAVYEYLDVIYMESEDTIETRMYDEAERRKVSILKAVNRKDVEKTENLNIRNFVSELLSHTQMGPEERDL